MSTSELPPRPRQLIWSAGVIIGGSLLLVASVFDSLAGLQSVETREQLREVLGSQAGRDLGVTLAQATAAVRVAVTVTGVCAAMAFVLGIFVLQRHRGARVALTVLAVPFVLTAPVAGGFLGVLVAVASVLLWSGPAGDWYAGRAVRTPDKPETREASGEDPPAVATPPSPGAPAVPAARSAPSTLAPSGRPGATEGFGRPAPTSASPAPPEPGVDALAASAPYAVPTSVAPGRPPSQVRMACLVAAVFSGVVTLLCIAAMVALVIDPEAIVDQMSSAPEWSEAGLSEASVLPLLWVFLVMFLAWSIGAVVLAWLVWRRHDWARYLLVVSAGLTLLIGIVSFPVGIPHQIACVVTGIALFSPAAREWFGDAGRRPPAG